MSENGVPPCLLIPKLQNCFTTKQYIVEYNYLFSESSHIAYQASNVMQQIGIKNEAKGSDG